MDIKETDLTSPEARRERTITLGLRLLKNAFKTLGLPDDHITADQIHVDVPEKWLLDTFPGEDASGLTDPHTNQIYIAKNKGQKIFSPTLVCKAVIHEGAHLVSFLYRPFKKLQIDNTNLEAYGNVIQIIGTEFFRGIEEGNAEHFTEYAVAVGQNILEDFPEYQLARISPKDEHLDQTYIHDYDFWNIVHARLAEKRGISLEDAKVLLLHQLSNGGLQELFSDEEVRMIGLYGVQLKDKRFFGDIEPLDNMIQRDELIALYCQTDDVLRQKYPGKDPNEVRNTFYEWTLKLVKEQSDYLYEKVQELPKLMRAIHQTPSASGRDQRL